MQASFATWVSTANQLLVEMASARTDESKVLGAINLSNHILGLISREQLRSPEDIIGEHIIQLQNSERFDSWFQSHPDFEAQRSIFEILNGVTPAVQAKLYWLKKRSNALMAGAVHFTPNWEDAQWSRNDNYKIGIDFFLSPDASSLNVALSNMGKLRVLELGQRLTNTDIEVFEQWGNVAETEDRTSLHGKIWESFRLQTVNSKFYRGIAEAFSELHDHLVASGKKDQEAKMFASRLLGRLIFVWFIRKMRLISEDIEYFEPAGLNQGEYYAKNLERLFFRTFNSPVDSRRVESDGSLDLFTPYLSGGLFEPRVDDWVGQGLSFPDDFFTRLYDHFSDFNFTTDESTPDYEQVAIDPEMLGRVFESLLASQIESTGEQARKAKGAFYTPREIVAYMCKEALRQHLLLKANDDTRMALSVSKLLDTPDQDWAQASSNKLSEIPIEVRSKLVAVLKELKSLDPACGSGAFPLGLLQLLTKTRLRLEPNLDAYKLKLSILQNNIFGSDIEPMAIEISRLRSWLSIIVEQHRQDSIDPLPNLDFNFVSANSLIPLEDEDLFTDPAVQRSLEKVRTRYFLEKDPSAKEKLRAEYRKLTAPDFFDNRSNQLRTFDPFETESVAQFFDPETMFGITKGFDLVIGNPPYVDYRKIDGHTKTSLLRYSVSKHSKMINLYLYFFELGIVQLSDRGVLAFISPQQYLIYENTKGLRDLIRTQRLVSLSDFARVKVFDAATYTFVTILERSSSSEPAKYEEFDQIFDLTKPTREKYIENPIPEPVDVSEFSELVVKIEAAATGQLGDFAEIFCASSSTEKTSLLEIGPIFIAASNIFPWRLENASKFVSKIAYSSASLRKQHGSRHILTSRMTTNIRATIVDPGKHLGGKVNVVIAKEDKNLEVFAAFLNSRAINFWYRQKYSMQHMQGGALPVNTTELEKVPVILDFAGLSVVRALASQALSSTASEIDSIQAEIDRQIYKAFDLSADEIQLIENS